MTMVIASCSFVIVWDKPHVDRTKLRSPHFNTSFFTFVGEMVATQPAQDTPPGVRGNCFACRARDIEDVKQKMRLTSYYKEVCLVVTFVTNFLI